MRTQELDLLGLTLSVCLEIEDLDSLVDGLLRHGSVGRPLSSGDGEKSSLRDVDHVVPDQRLGILSIRISNERSDSRPGGEDVSSSDFDLGSEVVSNLVENPLDLGLLGDGILLDGSGSVGGTCKRRKECRSMSARRAREQGETRRRERKPRTSDNVSLPGKEEDDSTVGGSRIEQTHGLGSEVGLGERHGSGKKSQFELANRKSLLSEAHRKGDVNSRGRSDDLLDGRLVELPETIGERSCGVDDTLK